MPRIKNEHPPLAPNAKWRLELSEYKTNDLSLSQFQLAVFSIGDNHIYKLSCLDFRGRRFDVSGEKYTRYLRFDKAVLFNFTTELEYYYNLYIQNPENKKSFKKIYDWLAEDNSRLALIDDDGE